MPYILWTRSVIKEQRKWIEAYQKEAMSKLPREYNIIKLRFFEGKTQMEVAKKLIFQHK